MAILLSLGTWQVQRLHWKERLVADIEARRTAPPVDVTEVERLVAAGEDIDYRAMRASGLFLHDRERHFLATYNGQAGYYVYTPLQLADGRYLFVNRGFVPYDNKPPETREAGLVGGEQRIAGLARSRLAEKPGFLVPDNDPAKNIFYWKDLVQMAVSVGLSKESVLPFFLDADDTPVPGGLPIGGVTQIDLPNNHLQYAITWYGLAFALALVATVSFLRRRKQDV
ncbi:SURF1 family protein [Ciceribacter sp. L1K22]|uniref:SURF1 family protein n=1 Tax=Ciceribacter sp. L1K22 TaxID=2820275 RepID=UPI001ABDFEED|nr:SURF1 family protein [Ciceribacter sp. L1K22]MBO3759159.1 SURF1 family protein [Ciceribacter sp. L1K22]